MVRDASEGVGEPCLRIDTVQLGCFDQSVHEGRPVSATSLTQLDTNTVAVLRGGSARLSVLDVSTPDHLAFPAKQVKSFGSQLYLELSGDDHKEGHQPDQEYQAD